MEIRLASNEVIYKKFEYTTRKDTSYTYDSSDRLIIKKSTKYLI